MGPQVRRQPPVTGPPPRPRWSPSVIHTHTAATTHSQFNHREAQLEHPFNHTSSPGRLKAALAPVPGRSSKGSRELSSPCLRSIAAATIFIYFHLTIFKKSPARDITRRGRKIIIVTACQRLTTRRADSYHRTASVLVNVSRKKSANFFTSSVAWGLFTKERPRSSAVKLNFRKIKNKQAGLHPCLALAADGPGHIYDMV